MRLLESVLPLPMFVQRVPLYPFIQLQRVLVALPTQVPLLIQVVHFEMNFLSLNTFKPVVIFNNKIWFKVPLKCGWLDYNILAIQEQ